MADEYQVEYEYSDGNTISFKTDDMRVATVRSHLTIDTRVDGVRVVTDPGFSYRVITCTAFLTGNDMDTLDSVQGAAIDYTGAYPRLKKIYWDGDSTETNVEVALMDMNELDRGAGWWLMSLRFEGKDQ
jgi:hypothetical protein